MYWSHKSCSGWNLSNLTVSYCLVGICDIKLNGVSVQVLCTDTNPINVLLYSTSHVTRRYYNVYHVDDQTFHIWSSIIWGMRTSIKHIPTSHVFNSPIQLYSWKIEFESTHFVYYILIKIPYYSSNRNCDILTIVENVQNIYSSIVDTKTTNFTSHVYYTRAGFG